MSQILNQRINNWKKSLLDFGKRNKLINFRETKRSNVHIINPLYEELYDLIAIQEKELKFPFAKKILIDEHGEETFDTMIEGDIDTTKSLNELQKSLKVLRYRANTSIEEQGVNILFLAFGLLKWKENDNSSQTLLSPLVLVPVKLKLESLASPYILSLYEDEIVINPTLLHKLDNDFGINFPEFDSSKDNIKAYLNKIENLVKNNGWTIERCVNLTYLSFLKINMYKDLDRNIDKLKSNPIIAAIVGDNDKPIGFPEELRNFDHDNKTTPLDTFQVVDADSSQQDAILLSKKGVSFVLQGPPGTGKSQTITNIIAEALADNKTVLFVSEKMAALQVVYNRLSEVGLSDFCFNLHSHKANKKEILKQLDNTRNIEKKKVKAEAISSLDMLERKRKNINEYQKELHTTCSALKTTIFNINGRLAKLEKIPKYIFEINDVINTTEKQLRERTYLLKELAEIIDKSDMNFSEHPWRDTNITYLSYELRLDIVSNIENILPLLNNIQKTLSLSYEKLELNCPITINGLKSFLRLLKISSESYKTLPKWVNINLDELKTKFYQDKELHNSTLKIKKSILEDFDDKILNLDYYPILQRFRGNYAYLTRFLKRDYYNDLRQLNEYRNKEKLGYKSSLEILNKLQHYSEQYNNILRENDLYVNCYNHFYNKLDTDWNEILEAINYAIELKKHISSIKFEISSSFVSKICSDTITKKYCLGTFITLSSLYNSVIEKLDWVLSLFDNNEVYYDMDINDLIIKLTECKDKIYLLEEWIIYSNIRKKCVDLGLGSYIKQIEEENINPKFIVKAYLKRFYILWLDSVLPNFPAIKNFYGNKHIEDIKEFSYLDKLQFKIAQARVRERIISQIPDFDFITSTNDEVGILKRELNKQRKIMPLRKLFMSIPNLIKILKPCFMMSPLSVSVFLEAKTYEFDLVIFDEASQVHTEDAIGAIMRGKQVIIVGDTEQLPPTNFFSASLLDDDYDVDNEDENNDIYLNAYDSILEEAVSVLPELSLRWHYRSRHEHLIAFSNAKIYNNNLITFPSIIDKEPNFGVEYFYVKDGVYDRGGKRNNIIEAKYVADLVFKHFQEFPERSLGIVTFSENQQMAVDHAIRHKRHQNGAFEEFFSEEKDEPFFIKNLENVQGDERDTIIFSIGYAKDQNGIIYMNFGPLSRSGGYRRLNVAITRAKYNVKLVGSIMPEDIDLDRTSSKGVQMLKSYIEFAQQGVTALQKELNYSHNIEFDSPFEESVYEFLTSKGFKVITQVGCSGFRIDMAVKDPNNEEFIIGIECDGATYHSTRTVRERDRLRQSVLENMGWTIYRIWSTDWIKNPQIQGEKLINAINAAASSTNKFEKKDKKKDKKKDINIEIEEKIISTEKRDNICKFKEYQYEYVQSFSPFEVPEIIKRVVKLEQPICLYELCKRILPKYNRQKVTLSFKSEILYMLHQLKDDLILRDDFFIITKDFKKVEARRDSNNMRKIEHIAQDELIEALTIIMKHSIGITKIDLLKITSKELGFTRFTTSVKINLEKAYSKMIKNGIIKEVNGKVFLVKNKT